MYIGIILNQIRLNNFISLRDLSQKMGLGNEGHIYLSKIECNRVIPTENDIINYCNCLQANHLIDDLLKLLPDAEIDNSVPDLNYIENRFFKYPKNKELKK